MQQKSERFEMRLDAGILDAIDSWRRDQSDVPSRSEAVRRLIETGLGRRKDKSPQISDGEKLVLLMLSNITKELKLHAEIEPDFVESVIHGGHYWGLDWKYGGIFHGHSDSEKTVSEVVDILDMWSFIEEGVKRIAEDTAKGSEAEDPAKRRVSFPGFDGNNESEHASVAAFMIEKLERFSSFKSRAHLNSHMPTLDGYRRMLAVFLPIRSTLVGIPLSGTQIDQILNARRYRDDQ